MENNFELALQKFVKTHPQAAAMLSPTAVVTREIYAIPREIAKLNVSEGLLHGATLLRTAPYLIVDNTQHTVFAAFSLGSDLAGYPGMAHGGLIAMLLDEIMGKAALTVLGENKVAHTARLAVEYLEPVAVNGHVVLIAKVTLAAGRKIWVSAVVEGNEAGVTCARSEMLVTVVRQSKL